jgi:hypothetical protein
MKSAMEMVANSNGHSECFMGVVEASLYEGSMVTCDVK